MPPGRPRKNQDVLMKSAELIGWAIGGLEREISQTKERLAALTAQAAKLRKRAGVKSVGSRRRRRGRCQRRGAISARDERRSAARCRPKRASASPR